MAKTSIEWTDFSINPFRARAIETGKVGHWCVKISCGCKFCYASRHQSPYLTQLEYRAENRPKVELFFDEKAIEQVIRRKKPTRYFWCDMTDMFLADYPDEWIDRCFAAMALTPQHTHMVLTKRAERMRDYVGTRYWYPGQVPLPNVWLGVSVEDRKNKDRIDYLSGTPAAVRFLSIEPLLEDIGPLDLRGIDWVIAGAESGPGARPAEVEWFRKLKDQCVATSVPFFLKQYAANGKKIPLPELDGKVWDEIPEVTR